MTRFHGCTKTEVVQAYATRECNIELSVGSGATGQVNKELRDSLALGFMNRNRPGKNNRELAYATDNF